jgi:outer membrane biosynthesis protein TonB
LEQADIDRMEYDPARADDVHLRSRSQKLGSADADATSARVPSEAARNRAGAPPVAAPARPERDSPPPGVAISQLPAPQAAPPAPASIQIGAAPSNNAPAPARPAAQAEAARGTTELGLEVIQAQYLAQVRAKIRKNNDRIMPRKWVEDMLNGKVSADFELSLGRGGKILSVRLYRSTGYPQLDAIARQAIYMASPFEGYPQQAGESIICTVTVHYDR